MWHAVLKDKIQVVQIRSYLVCKLVRQKPDVKKHSDKISNKIVQHIARELIFEFGHL